MESKAEKLSREFYTQPTLWVAQNLLGKYFIRKVGKKKLIGKIIETEAYIGPQDRASHAYKGKKTKRNEAEFLIGGHVYIYLVYGMYWQFNISTSQDGKPECVLVRAVEPVATCRNQDIQNLIRIADGPGKVCRYFQLDQSFYGEDLVKSKRIWIEN